MASTGTRRKCWIATLGLLLFCAIPSMRAQVFEVNGGTSSLYDAQGATITARGPSFDASLGAGVVDGKLVGGANLTRKIGNATYVAGSDYIHFNLPTDIFDSSAYLVALGAGVTTKMAGTDVFAFAGATSSDFNSPFVDGVRAESPSGILFLRRRIASQLQVSSNMVFSGQVTAIQSVQWQPADKTHLAVSAGVGANQPYAAGSFDFLRSWIDLKAAYIDAGSQFQRVAVNAPLFSEPDRENAVVTVHPTKFLSVSGGRQNFLSPVSNSNATVRAAVNSVAGNVLIKGTSLSGSLYHSSYLGNWNNATAYTAGRSFFSRVQSTASYLESRPNDAAKSRAFLANFTETLTPRLDVTELVTRSQGQTSVSFGGGFLSNVASISAEYQTYYVPERNNAPFEQALILDLQLHVIHGLALHGSTFVAPDGSLRYTADEQMVMVRQGFQSAGNGEPTLAQGAIGSSVIRGTVVDSDGHPVAGAAIMIDKLLVYTSDDGSFFVREHKPRTHVLKVMPAQFLDGASWQVITAPGEIRSSVDGGDPQTRIVVAHAVHGGG
ncbi:MAG TPA: hypothetical protein VME68_18095 [Acidobacteriaceae bacterium]|nr:hypothetical protein [Acidobacteriaceae bacterium]